jgi:hypothetical protein
MKRHFGSSCLAALICLLLSFAQPSLAQSNQVLGEIELIGRSKVEKTSGVWVDGQYLGYLKELKGSKKILLLPGEHEISVRQNGYQDFTEKIMVRPGEKQTISVSMVKDPRFRMPSVFSEIKLLSLPIGLQCSWTDSSSAMLGSSEASRRACWWPLVTARSRSVCPATRPSIQRSIWRRIKNSNSKPI